MKLYDALSMLREIPADAARIEVYLACGFTPLHFKTLLAAEIWGATSKKAEIDTGLYGDLQGSLEKAARAGADAVICALEWPDLDPRLGLRSLGGWSPALFPDILQTARQRMLNFERAVQALSAAVPVALSLPTLPLPPISFTSGDQASTFEQGLRLIVAASGERLSRLAGLKVLSESRLNRLSPAGERLDVKSALLTGFPYSLPHAGRMAEMLGRLISDVAPKKGLITDLDGAMWKGLVGEIGPGEISWTLDGRAQIHGLYQQLLAALSDAGVLLACASKNDPEVVRSALAREDLALPPEKLFPVEAGWGPKSQAVTHILRSWNISADSVVFVDDSAMELAEVAASHPGIQCVLFPREEQAACQMLEDLRDYFGKSALREEDSLRAASIRRNAGEPAPALPASAEDFLAQAEARFSAEYFDSTIDPRSLELINKTNQFNLNGRRYTHAALGRYLQQPGSFMLTVSYRDKYGPLGKIAVLCGCERGAALDVGVWVMSCRAFSRRIEYWCLQELFRRFETCKITFDFQSTERNGPLREFLTQLLDDAPAPGCKLTRVDFEARGFEMQLE
ncbi:MAG: HAD-IIIC family phosphatase, partial [Terriglobia bacterium]